MRRRIATRGCVSLALLAGAAQRAQEHALYAYDAAHVAAATQTGGTLVSCDARDLVSKGPPALLLPLFGKRAPSRPQWAPSPVGPIGP
jgi:predicted nucleic acid-binding protein